MFFFSSKVKVADSGLFDGFTDMHCHVLPGVDDGVKTQEESLQILQRMEGLGVKGMWLTSHVMEDVPNTPEGLCERFRELKASYGGNITLHLAAEHMLDGLFRMRMADKQVLPHANDTLLVETSYSNPPLGMKEMLEQVKSAGYYPLLAHPERYLYMDKGDYRDLKEAGVRFQLNLPSLVGLYGDFVQKRAQKLLAEGVYDCMGTDLHSFRQLQVLLDGKISRKCVKLIVDCYGN